MSIFGKVLALLNVLGMALLIMMALKVYTLRVSWQYANYRYDLAAEGLPLHKQDSDAPGHYKYEDLSQQTLKDLFSSNPVMTQKEEVERVQKAVLAKITGTTDQQQQTVLLTTLLMPFARTNTQRERLLSIRRYLVDKATTDKLKLELETAYKDSVADKTGDAGFVQRLLVFGGEPRQPFEQTFLDIVNKDRGKADTAFTETLDTLNKELKDQLDREIKEVLDGKRTFDGVAKEMTPEERKDANSTLLFNLVEAETGADEKDNTATAAGYKRYITVVGLEQASRTINRQAAMLNGIINDLATEQSRDRTQFSSMLQPILIQSAGYARTISMMTDDLAREDKKVKDQKVLVEKRKDDVKVAKDELAVLQDTMAEKLGKLKAMSAEVFKIRVAVRDATVENQKSETRIRQLEGYRWLPFVGGQYLINREEP